MTKDQILEMFNTIKGDPELTVEFFELVSNSHDFVEMVLSEQEGYDDDDENEDDYDDEDDGVDNDPENNDNVEDAAIKSKPQLDTDDN